MSCNKKTFLENRLAYYESLITQLETALLDADGIKSYELETNGEGRQKVTYRSVDKMQKALDVAYRQHEYICNRLCGRGMIAVKLRRKPGC